jgi:hypothetical protein
MLWNEISYEEQVQILEKICDLARQETNFNIKKGLVAALNELDLWSNSPCPEYVDRDIEDGDDIPCFFETEDHAVPATVPYSLD